MSGVGFYPVCAAEHDAVSASSGIEHPDQPVTDKTRVPGGLLGNDNPSARDEFAMTPGSGAPHAQPEQILYDREAVVWAVNVGGDGYRSADGIHFVAEEAVTGGELGAIDIVEGAQDDRFYRSYRLGELRLKKPLPNGAYDLTFHFAEPLQAARGERVFDVIIQGEKRIEDMDISRARDSSNPSALLRTVPRVLVDDGLLDIRLSSSKSLPVLSGVVVRERRPAPAAWGLVWSDEFDYGVRPNAARWTVERWEPCGVSGDPEAYTDHPGDLRVEAGSLVIEAHRAAKAEKVYTSARVHSRGRGDFLYGREDIRARLPAVGGFWGDVGVPMGIHRNEL